VAVGWSCRLRVVVVVFWRLLVGVGILVGEDRVSSLVVQASVLEQQCWLHVVVAICCEVLVLDRPCFELWVGLLLCDSIGWSVPQLVVLESLQTTLVVFEFR
jgi:hypothetical protein